MTTTPATHRAAEALRAGAGVTFPWAMSITPQMLAAALDGPEGNEGMDEATAAVHDVLCEDSTWECLDENGPCVRAVKAVRRALLGETP